MQGNINVKFCLFKQKHFSHSKTLTENIIGSSFSNDIKFTLLICDNQFLHWKQKDLSSNIIICFINDTELHFCKNKCKHCMKKEK